VLRGEFTWLHLRAFWRQPGEAKSNLFTGLLIWYSFPGDAVKHPGRTSSFRGPKGELGPRSIAETAYLRLGGLDQWVMIRGESAANPLLIFLHGGSGYSR
jgi:hypothetical protein